MGEESIQNAEGKVLYGMHFYPGVAQYQEPNGDSYKIFLNERTIRSMDSTFAGKPVFVEHVDEVSGSIDEVRKEADGWVVESFFNAADGKHWVKFIIVSDRGERAVKNGFRLSNAYIPTAFAKPGVWNGVEYRKEVTSANFEHLALVKHPRYDESVVMTPEEFKKYNSDQELELKKIANSKGDSKVKLNFFNRTKIENSVDLEKTSVELPKSKIEMTISEMVAEMDTVKNMHGYASDDHMVKVGNAEMSVKDLVKKHMDMCNEMDEMKKPKDEENSEESLKEDKGIVGDRGGDENLKNDDSEDEKKKNADAEEEKKKNSAEKAKLLKNAGPDKVKFETGPKIDLMPDRLARGRELF